MERSVLVVHAGGTIGMQPSPDGYQPAPGLLPRLMEEMPELRGRGLPRFVVHELDRLLDSSNMTQHDWNGIGHVIARQYGTYDGFVLLHGTDTMAYTASALSFMLEGLSKPLILTGSQLPLGAIRTDAKRNLITTVEVIASGAVVPEVCIYFNNHLLRGN